MNVQNWPNYRIKSLFVKPTAKCNLRCEYCYCHRGNNNENLDTGNPMELETWESIFRAYADYLEHTDKTNPLHIIWHGGEPLLAGKDYFRRVMELQATYRDRGYKVTNSLQTNCTLLDMEWVSIFKENHFSLGISLDGPKHIHELHRRSVTQESYFDRVLKNIRLLQENDVPLGALGVVTSQNARYAEDIFHFFYNELNIPLVDFIPCFYHGNDGISPSSDLLADFYKKVFDLWTEKRFTRIKITFLDDLLNKTINYLNKTAQPDEFICELTRECGRNLAVLPNGDVYPCECLVNVREMKLGNVGEKSLRDILTGQEFEHFYNLCNQFNPECAECKYWEICQGGCFHRRLPGWTVREYQDSYCEMRKNVIAHIEKFLLNFQGWDGD